LTDVDDKIILKIEKEGKSLQEITSKYTDAFFEDLDVMSTLFQACTMHLAKHL